jgi:hypothetical protein
VLHGSAWRVALRYCVHAPVSCKRSKEGGQGFRGWQPRQQVPTTRCARPSCPAPPLQQACGSSSASLHSVRDGTRLEHAACARASERGFRFARRPRCALGRAAAGLHACVRAAWVSPACNRAGIAAALAGAARCARERRPTLLAFARLPRQRRQRRPRVAHKRMRCKSSLKSCRRCAGRDGQAGAGSLSAAAAPLRATRAPRPLPAPG